MKSLLITAALAGVSLTAGTAFAYTAQDPKAPITAPSPKPIASSVVKPVGLPIAFTDQIINVEFTLDAEGRPHEIKLPWVYDKVLKKQFVEAFRQWRFAPGVSGDAAANKRFILPVELKADA